MPKLRDQRHVTRSIEVLRPGTFTPQAGGSVTFSADDLRALAASYDYTAAPAPLVVGHPQTNDPAYGWVTGLAFNEDTQRLVAEAGEMAPSFEEAVGDGRYKRVSVSLFNADAPNNPKPGQPYLRHVGFLGARAPAVPNLEPVRFADADETNLTTIELGDPGFRDVAGVLRSFREWIIDQFGMDAADKALPDWEINWIESHADRDEPKAPAFAAPSRKPAPSATPKEPSMTTPVSTPDPEPTDLAEREAALAQREAALRNTENTSFADGLVAAARLAPASKPAVIAVLNALPSGTEVSFAEGDEAKTTDLAEAVKAILSAQPKIVPTGETDLGDPPGGPTGSAEFSSPDGAPVNPERLAVHHRAVAYQKQHPDTDYLDAVKAVS